jgi:inhibitor of KinA sporulation pathway (predicted exonuclease)
MATQLVLFDLEFTAWEGSMARAWSRPHEHREIVQIGAVRLDAETLEELAALDLLVLPRINSNLSDYFVELTGITNQAVAARGRNFALAYQEFLAFVGDAPAGCFGRDDRVLMENLALYTLSDLPRPPRTIDLKAWIVAQGVDLTGIHSGMITEQLGLTVTGRIHNALDDARALASAARHFVAKGEGPPWLNPPDIGSAR